MTENSLPDLSMKKPDQATLAVVVGLCWQPNILADPRFLALVTAVKERFDALAP